MRPLPAMPPPAVESLLLQLKSRGFACISLEPWIKDALQSATSQDAATMNGFRFPPLEGRIVYTESKRQAFRALFEVATTCFLGLLKSGGVDQDDVICKAYVDALQQIRDGNNGYGSFRLFSNENEPFEAGQPFSQSFFNLFNYNHGSLNSHVDRSLLTIIYSKTQSQTTLDNNIHRSALWVKDNNEIWHNADQVVTRDEAIVMVGEDLVEAGGGKIASTLELFAAEHAVRVDPMGDRIERSHFRKDPSCTDGVINRLSAAMILRHEL